MLVILEKVIPSRFSLYDKLQVNMLSYCQHGSQFSVLRNSSNSRDSFRKCCRDLFRNSSWYYCRNFLWKIPSRIFLGTILLNLSGNPTRFPLTFLSEIPTVILSKFSAFWKDYMYYNLFGIILGNFPEILSRNPARITLKVSPGIFFYLY